MGERYPVRIDGETAGELAVEREGLWTVFSLRCRDPGRLLRLSVYGGGREGYLGVPAPEAGAMSTTGPCPARIRRSAPAMRLN